MSGEKTEQPTSKRLRDAREKGQVAKSQDVPSALVVMALGIYLVAMGRDIFQTITDMAAGIFALINVPYDDAIDAAAGLAVEGALKVVLPPVIIVMAVSLIGNLAQVGVLFSAEAATPKMENLNPAKWFKKTFSQKNAVELLKNLIKIVVLAGVVHSVLDDHWRELFLLPRGTNISSMWEILGSAVADLIIYAAAAFAGLAALDYLYQRYSFNKENMMSKQEVKQEYKESEGDPQIKSKRKQLHQEMMSQNTLANVRRAKVLVTNPTHVAVALDYEEGRTKLPVVVAKGEGNLARRMIELAQREGIPIMRQAPLARELFKYGMENSYIPRDLIGPVAEVLRWVKSLEQNP
ncbi:EscU/YscU/HrcU family type III secretion system export apparatus switch protein [Deltaproteobacteria bacterium Smac51]|nr:EscU/YscU/HrcU family type III secretion system export apparatus switch protein [Deltaproteobacteria bacterium Smac51]